MEDRWAHVLNACQAKRYKVHIIIKIMLQIMPIGLLMTKTNSPARAARLRTSGYTLPFTQMYKIMIEREICKLMLR